MNGFEPNIKRTYFKSLTNWFYPFALFLRMKCVHSPLYENDILNYENGSRCHSKHQVHSYNSNVTLIYSNTTFVSFKIISYCKLENQNSFRALPIYPFVVNILHCLVISLDIDSLDYFFLLKYLLWSFWCVRFANKHSRTWNLNLC